MKKLIILTTVVAALCSCTPKNTYIIDGNIKGKTGYVYLLNEQEEIIDSAATSDGVFRFKGIAETPSISYIFNSHPDQPFTFAAMVLLEPGVLTVTGDTINPENIAVTGTPANEANSMFWKKRRELTKEFRDSTTTDERREDINEDIHNLSEQMFNENSTNYFGAVLLAQDMAHNLTGAEILDAIAKIPAQLQQSKTLTDLKTLAETKIKTDVGQPYINIMQSDAAGTVITLTSVVENPANKYILLDFWASWCGPCMGEVPYLLADYAAYHDKGFEIYGVSFDKDREKWLAAVVDNKMNWIQVSDLNGFDNPAAKEYAIQGIPANFLIEAATGKIVANNLRGEALGEKLAELLGK